MGDTRSSAAPDAGQIDSTVPKPSKLPAAHVEHSNPEQLGANSTSTDQTVPPQSPQSSQPPMSSQQLNAGTGPFKMTQMVNNLPPMQTRSDQYFQGGQPRFNPAVSPSMIQNLPPMPHYAPPHSMPIANQNYYMQQPSQMGQYYNGGQLPQSHITSPITTRSNMPYYPGQMMMNHQQGAFYYPPTNSYPSHAQAIPPNVASGHYQPGNPSSTDPRIMSPPPEALGHPGYGKGPYSQGGDHSSDFGSQYSPADGRQNAVRGPPRKPRQSGHAIWIGNLPPHTDLMSLVRHVCKETPGLESLFLISKSNCAFANFKDEQTCSAAQQKLHESKFQTVRLVSRLRKSTVDSVSGGPIPTGPAAAIGGEGTVGSSTSTSADVTASPATKQPTQPRANGTAGGEAARLDKFFILKSLTVEDLEQSMRTGEWATQSHNENTLNNAFKTSDNVYLVFSANKSGEYFGYARMLSHINEDPAAAIKFAPRVQETNDPDLPKAIPTEATEHAPKGRIIDDSARGTIFWELEREDAGDESDHESEVGGEAKTGDDEGSQTWGKPFKLEWLSTSRLPFYRTRGLRNPWNSNREVKIARDGTELEPSVGRKLIGLFNRIQSPHQVANAMRPSTGMITPAYPQIRPYGP